MNTVPASVPMRRWAAQRTRLCDDDLAARFNRCHSLLSGDVQPALEHASMYSLPSLAFGDSAFVRMRFALGADA